MVGVVVSRHHVYQVPTTNGDGGSGFPAASFRVCQRVGLRIEPDGGGFGPLLPEVANVRVELLAVEVSCVPMDAEYPFPRLPGALPGMSVLS